MASMSQESAGVSTTLVQSPGLDGQFHDPRLPSSSASTPGSFSVLGNTSLKRKVDEILEGSLRRSFSLGVSPEPCLHPNYSQDSASSIASPASKSPSSTFGDAGVDVLTKMLRPCRNRCGAAFAYRSAEEDHINFGKCPKVIRVSTQIQMNRLDDDADDDRSSFSPLTSPSSPTQPTRMKRARVIRRESNSSLSSPAPSPSRPVRERAPSARAIPAPVRSFHRKSVLRSCKWPPKVHISDEHDTQVCFFIVLTILFKEL